MNYSFSGMRRAEACSEEGKRRGNGRAVWVKEGILKTLERLDVEDHAHGKQLLEAWSTRSRRKSGEALQQGPEDGEGNPGRAGVGGHGTPGHGQGWAGQ